MIRKVDCGSTSGGNAGVKANTSSRRRRKEQVPDSKSVIRPLLQTLSYEHSDEIALAIYRDISDTLECNRESEEYIERIRRELYILCNYNRTLTLSEKKFPRLQSLRNVLARYVELECAVLYSKTNPNNRSAREGEVEKRVQSLLYMMLYSVDQQHLVDYRLLHKSVLFVLQHVNKRYCAEGRLAHKLTIHVLQKYGKFDAIIKIKDSRQDFLIQHLRNNDPDIAFLSVDPYEDVKDFERNVFLKIPVVSKPNVFDPNVFVKSKCKLDKVKAIKNEGVKRRGGGVVQTIDLTDEVREDEEDKSEGACSIWKRDAFRKSPDLSSKDIPNRSSVQAAAVKSTNDLSASSRSRADDDIIIISDGDNLVGGGGDPVPSVEANFIDLTSDDEQEAHEVEEETVAPKETGGEDPVAVNQVNEIASADPPPINQVNEISNDNTDEPANAFHVFPRIRCLTINQVNEVSSSVISECDEVSRNEEVTANDGNVSSTGNSPSRNSVPYFNGEISSTTGKSEENASVEPVYFVDCNFENSPSQSGTVYNKKLEAEKDCGISSPTDENREPVKVQSIQPPQPNELVINVDDEDSECRKDDAEESTNDPCSSKQAQGRSRTPNPRNDLDDERETSAASCCDNERVEEQISQSVRITECDGRQGNVQSMAEKVEELKRRENDVVDENNTNLLSAENSQISELESPKQADDAVQLKSCEVDAVINHSRHNDDALEDISNSLEALINAGIDDDGVESPSLKKPLPDANDFQVDKPLAFEQAQFSDIIVDEYMELVSSVDDYETQITNHGVEGAQVAQSGNLENGKKRIENSNYQKVLEATYDNLQLGDSPTEDTELNLETVEIEDNNLQLRDPPAKNTQRNEDTVGNADLPMKQSDVNVDGNEPKRNTLEPVVEDHAQLNSPDVNTGDVLDLGDSPLVVEISENISVDNVVDIDEKHPDVQVLILGETEQILGESPKEQLQNDDVVIQEDTPLQNRDNEQLLHVIDSELGNSPSEGPELFVQEEPPARDEKIICESLRNAGGLELGDLPAGFKSDLSKEQATRDAKHDEIDSEKSESDQCVTNIDLELNEFKSSNDKKTERDFGESPEQKSIEPFTGNKEQSEAPVNDSNANHFEPLLTECIQRQEGDLAKPSDFEGNFEPPKDTSQCGDSLVDNFKTENSHPKAEIECSPLQHGSDDVVPCREHFSEINEHYTVTENASAKNLDVDISDIEVTVNNDDVSETNELIEQCEGQIIHNERGNTVLLLAKENGHQNPDESPIENVEEGNKRAEINENAVNNIEKPPTAISLESSVSTDRSSVTETNENAGVITEQPIEIVQTSSDSIVPVIEDINAFNNKGPPIKIVQSLESLASANTAEVIEDTNAFNDKGPPIKIVQSLELPVPADRNVGVISDTVETNLDSPISTGENFETKINENVDVISNELPIKTLQSELPAIIRANFDVTEKPPIETVRTGSDSLVSIQGNFTAETSENTDVINRDSQIKTARADLVSTNGNVEDSNNANEEELPIRGVQTSLDATVFADRNETKETNDNTAAEINENADAVHNTVEPPIKTDSSGSSNRNETNEDADVINEQTIEALQSSGSSISTDEKFANADVEKSPIKTAQTSLAPPVSTDRKFPVQAEPFVIDEKQAANVLECYKNSRSFFALNVVEQHAYKPADELVYATERRVGETPKKNVPELSVLIYNPDVNKNPLNLLATAAGWRPNLEVSPSKKAERSRVKMGGNKSCGKAKRQRSPKAASNVKTRTTPPRAAKNNAVLNYCDRNKRFSMKNWIERSVRSGKVDEIVERPPQSTYNTDFNVANDESDDSFDGLVIAEDVDPLENENPVGILDENTVDNELVMIRSESAVQISIPETEEYDYQILNDLEKLERQKEQEQVCKNLYDPRVLCPDERECASKKVKTTDHSIQTILNISQSRSKSSLGFGLYTERDSALDLSVGNSLLHEKSKPNLAPCNVFTDDGEILTLERINKENAATLEHKAESPAKTQRKTKAEVKEYPFVSLSRNEVTDYISSQSVSPVKTPTTRKRNVRSSGKVKKLKKTRKRAPAKDNSKKNRRGRGVKKTSLSPEPPLQVLDDENAKEETERNKFMKQKPGKKESGVNNQAESEVLCESAATETICSNSLLTTDLPVGRDSAKKSVKAERNKKTRNNRKEEDNFKVNVANGEEETNTVALCSTRLKRNGKDVVKSMDNQDEIKLKKRGRRKTTEGKLSEHERDEVEANETAKSTGNIERQKSVDLNTTEDKRSEQERDEAEVKVKRNEMVKRTRSTERKRSVNVRGCEQENAEVEVKLKKNEMTRNTEDQKSVGDKVDEVKSSEQETDETEVKLEKDNVAKSGRNTERKRSVNDDVTEEKAQVEVKPKKNEWAKNTKNIEEVGGAEVKRSKQETDEIEVKLKKNGVAKNSRNTERKRSVNATEEEGCEQEKVGVEVKPKKNELAKNTKNIEEVGGVEVKRSKQETDETEVKLKKNGTAKNSRNTERTRSVNGNATEEEGCEQEKVEVKPKKNELAKNIKNIEEVGGKAVEVKRSKQETDETEVKLKKNGMGKNSRNTERKRSVNGNVTEEEGCEQEKVEVKPKKNEFAKNIKNTEEVGGKTVEVKRSKQETDETEVKLKKNGVAKNRRNTERKRSVNGNTTEGKGCAQEKVEVEVKQKTNEMVKNTKNIEEQIIVGGKAVEVKKSEQEADETEVNLKKNDMVRNTERKRSVNGITVEGKGCEQEKVEVEIKLKKNEMTKNTEEQKSVGGKAVEVKKSKQEIDETEVKLKKNDMAKNGRNAERKRSANGNTTEAKECVQEKVVAEVKPKVNETTKNTEEQKTVNDMDAEVKRSDEETEETEVKVKKNDITGRKRSVNGNITEEKGCEQEKVEVEVKSKKNEMTENPQNTEKVGDKAEEVKRSKQETDEIEVKLMKNDTAKNKRNTERKRSVNCNTTEEKGREQEKVEVEVKPKKNEMTEDPKNTEEQKSVGDKAEEVKRSKQETDEIEVKLMKNDTAKNKRNTERKRPVNCNTTEEKRREQENVEVEVKPKKNEMTEDPKKTEEQKSVGDKAEEVKRSKQETDETEVKNDTAKNKRNTKKKRSVNCNTTEEKGREREKVEVEVKPKKNEMTKNTKNIDEQKSVGGKAVEVKKSKQEIDETEAKLKKNHTEKNSRNTEGSVNDNKTEEKRCEQEIDEVEVKAERIELEVVEVKSKRNEIIKKTAVKSDTDDDQVLRPKKNDAIKSHRKSLESKRNKLELAEAKPKRNESVKNSKHNVVEAELISVGQPAESKRHECEVKTKRNDFTKREKCKKMDLQEMDEVILAKETEDTETKSTEQENSEKQKTLVEVNGDERENEQEVKSKKTEESNAEESREVERETEKSEKVKPEKNEVIRNRRKTVDGNENRAEKKPEDVGCEKQKKVDIKENAKDGETNKLKKTNKIKNSKRNEQLTLVSETEKKIEKRKTVKSKEIDEGARKMASEKLKNEVVKCSKTNGHEKDLPSSMNELAKKNEKNITTNFEKRQTVEGKEKNERTPKKEVEKLEGKLEKNELIKGKEKSEQEVISMTEPKKKNEIGLEIVDTKENEEEITAIKQARKLETEIKDNCEEPPTSTNESEKKNEIAKNTDEIMVVKNLSSMNVPEKKNEIRVETAESKENEKEITSVKQAEELEIKFKTNGESNEQEKEPQVLAKQPENAKIINGFNLEENKEESEVITAKGIEQLTEKDIKIIETHKSMNNKRNKHEGTKSCKSRENRENKRKKVEAPPTVNETKRNENSENFAHKEEEIDNAQETYAERVTVANDVKNTKDCKEESEETSPKKLLEDVATEVINGDELKPEENEQAICVSAAPHELPQVAEIAEDDKIESTETKTLDVKVSKIKEDSLKTNDVNIGETESREPDENRGVSVLVTQKETLVTINVDDGNENIKDHKINEGDTASTKRKDELSIVEVEDLNAVKDLRKFVETVKLIDAENSGTPASEPENDVSKIEMASQIIATDEVANNKRKSPAEPVNESSKKLKLCIERLKQSLGDKLRVAETDKKDVKKARVKRTKHKLNKIEDIVSNLRNKETHKNESSQQKTAEPNGVATPDVLSGMTANGSPQKTAETNEKSDIVENDLKQCEQSPSDGVVEDGNERKNEAIHLVEGTPMVGVKERDGDVSSHNLPLDVPLIDTVAKQADDNVDCFNQNSPHHSPSHTVANHTESLNELPIDGVVKLDANVMETTVIDTVTKQDDDNTVCFRQSTSHHSPLHIATNTIESLDELPLEGANTSETYAVHTVTEHVTCCNQKSPRHYPSQVLESDVQSFNELPPDGAINSDCNVMEVDSVTKERPSLHLPPHVATGDIESFDKVSAGDADAGAMETNTNMDLVNDATLNMKLATDELPLDGAVKQRNLDEPFDDPKDVVLKEDISCPSSETPLDCVTVRQQGEGLEDSSQEPRLDDASVAKQGDLPFPVEQKDTNDPNNVASSHMPAPIDGAFVMQQSDLRHLHKPSPDGAFPAEQENDVPYCNNSTFNAVVEGACVVEQNDSPQHHEQSPDGAFSAEQKVLDVSYDRTNKDSPQKSARDEEQNGTKSFYEPPVHTSMDPVQNKVSHHTEIVPLEDVPDRVGNTTEQKMEEILTHDGSLPTEAAGNTPEQKMEIDLPVAENELLEGGEENETVESNLQPESTAILDGVGKEESMEVRKFIAVSNEALDVDDYYKALRDVLRNNNRKNSSSESHLHSEPEKSVASPPTENSNGDDNSNGEVKESALACNLLDCSATEEKDPAFSLYTQEEINDNSIVNPPSVYVEAKKKFDAKLIAATSTSATQKITSIYTPEEINGCTVHPKKIDPLNSLGNDKKSLLPLPHVSALLRSVKEVFIGTSSKQTPGCAYVEHNFMDLPPHVKLERSNVESNSFCASDDNDKSGFLHYNQKPPRDFFEQESKTAGNIDNICNMDGLNFLPHNMLHSDPIPMWRLGEVISENVDILTSNSNSMCEKQEYDDGVREERRNPGGEDADPEDFWSEREKENCGEKVQAFDNPIREENVAAGRIDVNEIPSRKTLKPSGTIHIILEPSEHNYCIGGPLLNAKPENNALKQVDGGNLCKMKGNEQVSDNSPVDGEHIFHFSEQIASLVKNNLTTLSMEDSPVDENNDDQDEQKIFSLIENSNSFSFSQPTVMSVEKMNDVMMAIANLNSLTSVQQNKKLDKQKVDFLFQQEDSISSNDSTVSNDIHSDCDFAINSIAMLRTQNTNMSDSVDDSDFTPNTSDEFTPPEQNPTINVIVKHNHSDFASMDSIFSGNDFDKAQSKTTTENNNIQPQANTVDVLVKQSNDASKNDGKKGKPKHKADVFIKQTNGKSSEAKLSTNILDDMLVKAMQRQNTRTRVLAAQKKVHKEKNTIECQTVTVINKIQTPSNQPPVLIPKQEITSDDKFPVVENDEPPVLTPEIHFAKFKPHEDAASGKETNSSTGARSKGEVISSQKPREDMIDSIKRRQRRPPEKYMDSVLLKVEKETQEEKFKVFEKNKIKCAVPVVAKPAKEKKPKKRSAADDESSNDSSMSVKVVRATKLIECGDFDENASSDEFYRNRRPNCKKLKTSESSDGSGVSDNDLDIKIRKERRMTSEERDALFDKVRDGKDVEDRLEQQKKTKLEAGVQKQVRFNLKPGADAKPERQHKQYKNACGPNVPTKGYYASGGHPQSPSHPDYRDRYTRVPAGGSQSSRYPSYPSQTGEQIYRSRSRSPLMKFGNASERRTGFQDYRVYANSRTTPYNGSRVHSGRRNVDLPTLLSHYSQIHRANSSSTEWSENVSGIGPPIPTVSFQAPSSEYFPPPPP